MRILLALDGSPQADKALDLTGSLTLPVGSTIRVITVVADLSSLIGLPWIPVPPGDPEAIERGAVGDGERILADAGEALQHPGREIEMVLRRGSAAQQIVREVNGWRPDLVVVGNRGLGPFKVHVLGSVSAAVIDHVSCPVLVARTSTVGRIAVAHDGSPFAANAAQFLADRHIFGGVEIDVLTAMDRPGTWGDSALPIASTYSREAWEHTVQEEWRRHEEIASTAAAELGHAGQHAVPVVLQGHPAGAIVDHARRAAVDLIVIGTHGRTGIRRIVLGSVARSVLLHTESSVLVVRPEPTKVPGRRVAVPVLERVRPGAVALAI
jgi:nucleotide-binding universal stress UspA family protein